MSFIGSNPAVDSGNSSTATLAGDATFTGDWKLADQPQMFCMSKSDVAGTLFFEFNTTGTGDAVSTFPVNGFSCAANVPEVHKAEIGPRYWRVRYVNGSAAQSSFTLTAGETTGGQLMAPLNQSLGLDADAILVRPTYPWLDISRSLASGISVVKKFGRNPAVGTSFVPVTQGSVYQTPQSGSATTLRIKAGGSANDTAAGSGALGHAGGAGREFRACQ